MCPPLFFTINSHFVTSNQISTYRKLNLPHRSSIYFVFLPLEMQKRLNSGADNDLKTDYHANFQQSFLAAFIMDVFFIRCTLWDIHIFSIYRKWWCHFHKLMRFWRFGENFHTSWTYFLYEVVRPLILIKSATYWGNYIEIHHF